MADARSSTSSCSCRSPGWRCCVLVPAQSEGTIRWITFWVMVVQLVADRVAVRALRRRRRRPAVRDAAPVDPDWGVYYQIGLDGYNVLLVLLTAFLGPLVVAGAFTRSRRT